MKEIRMQAINQFMATLGPEDLVYIPRRELLLERLKVHDININLKTEEEAQKLRDEQSNSEMAILEKEMLKSEIAKNKAQAMTNLTKAKEKNIEANKAAETPPEIPENESPEMKAARLEQEQAKTDDQRTKTALTVDKHNMDKVSMAKDMERQDQKHAVEMAGKISEHKTSMDIKKETAKHGMKMKEKMANKPKSKPVKEGGK
jgi:preprotein translocase subunit SecD